MPANPAPWTTLSTLSKTINYPDPAEDPIPGTTQWYFRGRKSLWGGFAVPISNTVPTGPDLGGKLVDGAIVCETTPTQIDPVTGVSKTLTGSRVFII